MTMEKYRIATDFDDDRKVMGWGGAIWKDSYRWKLIPHKYKTEKKALLIALGMIREDVENEPTNSRQDN